MNPYWQKQSPDTPLFPDIVWSKPEQRSAAGRLGIIGGNKLGFAAIADNYSLAYSSGIGQVRALLPEDLKKVIPTTVTETVFAASNPSGGLSKDALPDMRALGEWASTVLFLGDAGKNSETAIAYETFISEYEGPLVITRDAFDLVKNSASSLVERPDTLLVLSFAQLQKLFQLVYYPKILTFNMQLAQLVETLHKFTISYPIGLVTLHQDHIAITHDGQVVTMEWTNPMSMWRGHIATNAAIYWTWNSGHLLEAASSSLVETS